MDKGGGQTYPHARYLAGIAKRLASLPWQQRTIGMDEASTIFAASFGRGGWHHIVETLREFDADPAIEYRNTTLSRFLTRFTPQRLSDLVADVREGGDLPIFCYPWGPFNTNMRGGKDPLNSRFCGPSSEEFVKEEFDRIIALYQQLKQTGYRPWARGNGFIGGTFMQAKDGRRRFVVLQGNHRMAVFAHLGIERLPVRTMSGVLERTSESDCRRWPHVVDGTCAPDYALRVFRWFFEENGHHIARRLC